MGEVEGVLDRLDKLDIGCWIIGFKGLMFKSLRWFKVIQTSEAF